MCLGIPQAVLEINGNKATVQYKDRTKVVETLGQTIAVGDYVYAQADIVIAKMSKEEAELRIKALEMIQ